MKKALAILLAASLVLSLAVAGCSKPQEAPPSEQGAGAPSTSAESDVIKIGVFAPLTGAVAGGGELETTGMKLAQKLYPTVLGKKIELIIVDNKSDKVESATAVERLITRDKVSAIIGCVSSSLSMAAGPVIKEAKIPTVGTSCTNPLVTQGNEYYFRVCFIDPFQGKVMANYAYNKVGARKAAIIQEISMDYSVGLSKFFMDNFKKLTGDENAIVSVANYNTGDQDFTAQLTNTKAANPDVIFTPGSVVETATLIKQARQLGITCPILGGDSYEVPDFIEVGGKEVEGVIFSTFFDAGHPLTEESTKFIEAYKKEHNEEPSAYAALGYDAYLILYKAIEAAGSAEPDKIHKALLATKDFQGAAGVVNFDENRDAVKPAVLKTVKDGKFTYLDVVEPY